MVISTVVCLVVVYSCLYIKTFEKSILKTNGWCVFRGRLRICGYKNVYLKIMNWIFYRYSDLLRNYVLIWMDDCNKLQYFDQIQVCRLVYRPFLNWCSEIYKKQIGQFFRGTSILPKSLELRRFWIYSSFCFGIPMIFSLIVLSIDRSTSKVWESFFLLKYCELKLLSQVIIF